MYMYMLLLGVSDIENERGIHLVKMPPKMRKKGRPKGAGLTVIGLSRKAKNTKPSPFIKKSEWEKAEGTVMLGTIWLINTPLYYMQLCCVGLWIEI